MKTRKQLSKIKIGTPERASAEFIAEYPYACHCPSLPTPTDFDYTYFKHPPTCGRSIWEARHNI